MFASIAEGAKAAMTSCLASADDLCIGAFIDDDLCIGDFIDDLCSEVLIDDDLCVGKVMDHLWNGEAIVMQNRQPSGRRSCLTFVLAHRL